MPLGMLLFVAFINVRTALSKMIAWTFRFKILDNTIYINSLLVRVSCVSDNLIGQLKLPITELIKITIATITYPEKKNREISKLGEFLLLTISLAEMFVLIVLFLFFRKL